MHQYNIPTLLQIMACRLFGAKPLSESMLSCCQIDTKEHVSVKFYLRFKSFHSGKCAWRSGKWWPCYLGLNELIGMGILSTWQLLGQPVTKITSQWHFHFSVDPYHWPNIVTVITIQACIQSNCSTNRWTNSSHCYAVSHFLSSSSSNSEYGAVTSSVNSTAKINIL